MLNKQNKKGGITFSLEFIVKLVTSVLCLIVLFYLGGGLYGLLIEKTSIKQAEATLDELIGKLRYLEEKGVGESAEHFVFNPKGWYIVSYPKEYEKPTTCKDDICLCLCEGHEKKDCEGGVCKKVSKKVEFRSPIDFKMIKHSEKIMEAGNPLHLLISNQATKFVIENYYAPVEETKDLILLDKPLEFSVLGDGSGEGGFSKQDFIKVLREAEGENSFLLKGDNSLINEIYSTGILKGNRIDPLLTSAIIKAKYEKKYGLFQYSTDNKNALLDKISSAKQEEIEHAKELGVDCESSGDLNNAFRELAGCIFQVLVEGKYGAVKMEGEDIVGFEEPRAKKAGFEVDKSLPINSEIKPKRQGTAVLYWYTQDVDQAIKIAKQYNFYVKTFEGLGLGKSKSVY